MRDLIDDQRFGSSPPKMPRVLPPCPRPFALQWRQTVSCPRANRSPMRWSRPTQPLRANASERSHAELDSSPDLGIGNPAELGRDYRTLRDLLPHLAVLGGGGGTDHRHVEAIHAACQNPPSLS
jgi:hypothetical protein